MRSTLSKRIFFFLTFFCIIQNRTNNQEISVTKTCFLIKKRITFIERDCLIVFRICTIIMWEDYANRKCQTSEV